MVRYAPVAFLLVTAYQCHGDAKTSAPSTDAGTPAASATASAGTPAPPPPDDIFHKDPCRYVSQAETEAYLGPLLHAPYRGTDDLITPDSNGRFCLYRAKDGRSIDVSANWIDGQSQIKKLTTGFLASLSVNDKGKTDTLSDVWDQATIKDGSLFALKGDTLFEIGYGASKAGLAGATKLAECDRASGETVGLQWGGGDGRCPWTTGETARSVHAGDAGRVRGDHGPADGGSNHRRHVV